MNSVNKTRKLVGTAMLSAVGAILMYIGIKLPFMPSFITLDMADLPALIGSFAYGPARAPVICVLKNLLHPAYTRFTDRRRRRNFQCAFGHILCCAGRSYLQQN